MRFPPSLRNVEDLLAERGIDLCHETVRFLESYVTRTRDKRAALTFMKGMLKRHGAPERITISNHFAAERHN